MCPVRDVGRDVGRDVTGDGARDGEPDDGKQDVKLSRIKRKRFFFWPDMLNCCKQVMNTVFIPWSFHLPADD